VLLNIEFKFYWYKHVTVDARPLCSHLLPKSFFEMAGIPSAVLVFDGGLATELESYAKANVELLSRVANIALAILSPNLACNTGRSGTRTSRSTCAS